jgi:replicative DNA helicase
MHAQGCDYIFLDHLSIIVSDQSGDERKQLDELSTKLKTLCMELNIALIAVIHENRSGEIRGTAGVGQLANMVIQAKREIKSKDNWRRNVICLSVNKNRFSGTTGPSSYLFFDTDTGRLRELGEADILKYDMEAPL